ncbi:MAG TPA: LuxR C-terminal-related transcriptional regulator [Bauldia sp.]|nr:LuxR C-terminal-related transcriptional regulator [Bauldia sp.]
MEQTRAILRVTERLYAAALAEEEWSPALEAFADLFRGHHVVLHGFPGADGDGAFLHAARLEEDALVAAMAPEKLSMLMDFARLVPGGVSNRAALVDDRTYERSPYYNEVLRPLNGFHAVHVRDMRATASYSLNVCRPRPSDNFDREDVSRLALVAPHLTMAVEVRRRLDGARRHGESLASLVDRLDKAIVMADGAGRPVLVNTRAAEILEANDGLALSAGGLAGRSPAATAKLHAAVAGAANSGSTGSRRLTLERPSGRPPLVIDVLPLSRFHSSVPGAAEPRVAIFIAEPDADPGIDREIIGDAFGLTRREAEVAALLATGIDLTAIAAILDLGQGTVRNHLKRAFEKTGTHSQAALVALLRGFPRA